MKGITCQVIWDLLPLYQDQMLSDDSRALVEDHLSRCPHCAGKLAGMGKAMAIVPDRDTEPFLKIKKKLHTRQILTAALTAALVMGMLTLLFIHMTAPISLEPNQGIAAITGLDNGAVILVFSADAAGYAVTPFMTDSGGTAYGATVWDTPWNRHFGGREQRAVVINGNPDGGYDPVARIYYHSVEDRGGVSPDDQLIYEDGVSPADTGGVVTLPRLALSYYMGMAIILLILGIIILLLLRRYQKAFGPVLAAVLVPLAYILSQLCVKGVHFATHTLIRDFTGILLLMLPIYAALLLAWRLWRRRRPAG